MLFMHTSLNFLESCCSIATQNSIAASNVAKIWIWEGLVLKILYSLLPNPLHIKKLLEKSSNHNFFCPHKKRRPNTFEVVGFKRILRIWSAFVFFVSKATRRVLTSQILGSTFVRPREPQWPWVPFLCHHLRKMRWNNWEKNPQKEPKSSQAIGFLKTKRRPYETLGLWLGYVYVGMV